MKEKPGFCRFFPCLILACIVPSLFAETLYAVSRNGSDDNPGTRARPLQTIARAAERINSTTAPGNAGYDLGAGLFKDKAAD